jgi:hypothetical protein
MNTAGGLGSQGNEDGKTSHKANDRLDVGLFALFRCRRRGREGDNRSAGRLRQEGRSRKVSQKYNSRYRSPQRTECGAYAAD